MSPSKSRRSVKCSHCARIPAKLRGSELILLGRTCPHCKTGTFVETTVEETRKLVRNQGSLFGFPAKGPTS